MRTTKSIFGLIAAAIPVLYCGGLLLYFAGVRNSFGGLVDGGLGPTMLGLGAIGLLFLIALVVKVMRLFGGKGAPAAGGGGPADAAPEGEGSDFDPDAAIARYLARRSSGAHDPASPHPPPADGGPVRQAGFGRRGA
jgi:hypothetical protein